jgi:glutamate/tyrosine decarboxylase-like PLP-dependent enzyme
MATQAAYLKDGNAVAPKDMVPEFSRSARGVEVWAAMHSLGKQGVADMLDRCCDFAQQFAEGLENLGFEVLNDVVLNQIVATLPEHENLCADLAAHVQASGEAWFGTTKWRGKSAIRLSIVSWVTTHEDVKRTLASIEIALHELIPNRKLKPNNGF